MEKLSIEQVLEELKVGSLVYAEYQSTEGEFDIYKTCIWGLTVITDHISYKYKGQKDWILIDSIDKENGELTGDSDYISQPWVSEGDLCLGFVGKVSNDNLSVNFGPTLYARANNYHEAYKSILPQVGDLCAFRITKLKNDTDKYSYAEILSIEQYETITQKRNTGKNKLPDEMLASDIHINQFREKDLRDKINDYSNDVKAIIAESYNISKANDQIIFENSEIERDNFGRQKEVIHYSFALNYKNSAGELVEIVPPIFIGIKNDSSIKEKWNVEFVGLKAKNIKKIFQSHVFVDADKDIYEELSKMAIDEHWGFENDDEPYSILQSYFGFTYYNAWWRKLILEKGKYRIFNTGLVNKNYRYIYCVMAKTSEMLLQGNTNKEWSFVGFAISGEGQLGKEITKWVPNNELPKKVKYIKDYSDLFFDEEITIDCDYLHILKDNIRRLPVNFLTQYVTYKDKEEFEGIINNITDNDESFVELGYEKLQELFDSDVPFSRSIIAKFKDAVEIAISRATWNYKTAIPVYYAARDEISLLLPLNLTNLYDENSSGEADAALVVSKQPSGNYQGETIYTLDMAYQDARLITRPDSDWLNSKVIKFD